MAEKSVRGLDLHVVTKIVPVRLREELRQIDRLVEYGIFQSRSEAIRGS
jgi:Arc/MetJ-type ribon-helix-helix transcriptional regulator